VTFACNSPGEHPFVVILARWNNIVPPDQIEQDVINDTSAELWTQSLGHDLNQAQSQSSELATLA
jgi:hypothetical protein